MENREESRTQAVLSLLELKSGLTELGRINVDKVTAVKLVLIIGGLIILGFNSIYGFVLPHSNEECMWDRVFELTASINQFFSQHETGRHILLITSSLCMDILVIFTGLYWALYSKTWRLMVVLMLFYGIRSIVQNLFQMKFPDGYLWDYPNFPSVVVSYLRTSDFFFSGHVGLPVIVGLEWNRLKKNHLSYLCLLTCLLESFTMITLRGHYFIDLFTGIVVGHYSFLLVENWIHYIDNSCIGMKDSFNHTEKNDFEKIELNIKESDETI